jgi:hypothetical protein
MSDGEKGKTIKLIAAAVLGIAAVGFLAWNLGLIGGGATTDPRMDAAARRAAELQQKAEQAGFKEAEPVPTTPPPPGTGRKPFAPQGR